MAWSELMAKQITNGNADRNTCSVWSWNGWGGDVTRMKLSLNSTACVCSVKEIITPATVSTFITHTHTHTHTHTGAKCSSDTLLHTINVQNWYSEQNLCDSYFSPNVATDWQNSFVLRRSHMIHFFNLLKANDIYMCRTAALTSRRYNLYIYSTNIHTECFKHAA